MLTSLAPSPMDRVVFFGNLFRTRFTISAFYAGDTLHASTTSVISALDKNSCSNAKFALIVVSELPAIIRACFLSLFVSLISVICYLTLESSFKRSASDEFSMICCSIF